MVWTRRWIENSTNFEVEQYVEAPLATGMRYTKAEFKRADCWPSTLAVSNRLFLEMEITTDQPNCGLSVEFVCTFCIF